MAKEGKVLHGARIKAIFDGKEIGRLTGFTPSEDMGLAPVYGIGNLAPQEIVNLRWSGTFGFTVFVIEKEKIEDLGITKVSGRAVNDVIRDILKKNGFDIVIENKYTKERILTLEGCKIGTLNWTFTENAIVIMNGTGQFLRPIKA